MHNNLSSAVIVTWCLCDACGDLSQICALKLCIWSLHMRLVLPVLNHKVQSYILEKKISNLHDSLSWEPTHIFSKGLCSHTFFQKRRIGRGQRRVSVLPCIILTEFDILLWSFMLLFIWLENSGTTLIREIKIMNDYKVWKNIQFLLLPETILIPSMVPAIRLEIDYRDKETLVSC